MSVGLTTHVTSLAQSPSAAGFVNRLEFPFELCFFLWICNGISHVFLFPVDLLVLRLVVDRHKERKLNHGKDSCVGLFYGLYFTLMSFGGSTRGENWFFFPAVLRK